MTEVDESKHALIDAALAGWRQGDCVLDIESWFVFRTIAPQEVDGAGEGSDLQETQVQGFAILTQSCDIVRPYKSRPYLSVSPLVEVNPQEIELIAKGRRPRYAFVPGVAKKNLVADLDRVMTIDKELVTQWKQEKGCENDDQIRALALAIARKHARFAFPDEFNRLVSTLQNRIKEKHGKQSPEGDQMKALEEIRVRAAPSWDAEEIEIMIWFIAKSDNVADVRKSGFLPRWLDFVKPSGRFKRVLGQITTLEDMSAAEYRDSDQLDLDYLSDTGR